MRARLHICMEDGGADEETHRSIDFIETTRKDEIWPMLPITGGKGIVGNLCGRAGGRCWPVVAEGDCLMCCCSLILKLSFETNRMAKRIEQCIPTRWFIRGKVRISGFKPGTVCHRARVRTELVTY